MKDGPHGEVTSPQFKAGAPQLPTQQGPANIPQSPPTSPQGVAPTAPPGPVPDTPPAQPQPVAAVTPGKPTAGPVGKLKDQQGLQKGNDDWAKFESDDEKHGK